MSDVETVAGAYSRIHFACRSREVSTEPGGRALSGHQANILSHLDVDDPVMVTELAEHMDVTASTMSLNLKRLENGGFVYRERDSEDRRVMNVRLTEAGQRIRATRTLLSPERVHVMLLRLPPDQRRRAVEGLALLAEAADALIARRDDYVDSPTGEGPQ